MTAWNTKKIRVPNSNMVADFNGDCKADLFIETVDPTNNEVWYEFWLFEKYTGKYCLI